MKITLMDYKERKTTFDIGDIENIAKIKIKVLSGDELAIVTYKDYETETFDSLTDGFRDMGLDDGEYEIYDFRKAKNMIDNVAWLHRRNSDSWECDFED